MQEQDNPGVLVPPPLIYLAAFLIGLLLNKLAPLSIMPRAWGWPIAGALLAGWFVVWLSALPLFARAKTPLSTRKRANELITSGIYRLTRNPVYIGLTLLYLGAAVLSNSLWVLALLAPVVFVIDRGVVRREERYLERRFGDQYLTYKQRVRRWL